MAGLADERRVLVDGDGVDRHVERVDLHEPRGAFVVIPLVGPHGEATTGDRGETGHEIVTASRLRSTKYTARHETRTVRDGADAIHL